MIAAANGLIAVVAGAFAAHALKSRLAPEGLATLETGARYQMYHALALLAAAWVMSTAPSRSASAAAWCFLLGTILFSGSLYGLCLLKWRWLGPVTPLGGALLIVGWLLLAVAAMGIRSTPTSVEV